MSIDLNKIRSLPQNKVKLEQVKTGSLKYNHTDAFKFFKFIYNNKPISNKLSSHFWLSIKDVWVDKGSPRWRSTTSTEQEGVYDYINGVLVRSGINYSNTNYTIHTFIWFEFMLVKYSFLKIPEILENGLWDFEECYGFIDVFGELLWENRYELFDDGHWKNYQHQIREGIDERGEKCQLLIRDKFKEIWPKSTLYEDQDIKTGGGKNDYVNGIDGYVYFDDVKKTNQVKSSGHVILKDGNYWVPVSLKYDQYIEIDFISFVFGSNDNILVIDNKITNHSEEYINGDPFHLFNVESKHYSNF
jgi:hypothetical protein